MPNCSNCGKPTTVGQYDLITGKCPECRGVGMRATPVNLGCGTFIVIAIIVAMFSQSGIDDVEDDLKDLRSEVQQLRDDIQSQTEMLRQMQVDQQPESPRE
jgi:hypothetical protein